MPLARRSASLVAIVIAFASTSFGVAASPLSPTTSLVGDSLPDSPAGRCATAWLAVVSSGDLDAARAFEGTFASPSRLADASVEDRVARLPKLRTEFGAITVERVESSNENNLALKAHSATKGPITLEFRLNTNGKLDAIMITSGDGDGPPQGPAQPLSADRRDALIETACKAVMDEYVFPAKGKAMAEAVRAAVAKGDYASIANEQDLIARLTDDFRGVTNDKHLRVRVQPKSAGDDTAGHHLELDELRRLNWGFRSAEIREGNIGVLRFDHFADSDEARAVADAAMAFLSRCDAIVFDVRSNGGGSPTMLCHLCGYLFDEPTLLNRMVDRDGSITGEASSDEIAPGLRLRKDIPVYVVTSKRTFSCAEEFTYDLKCLKRATIVGETTGGGAHPVKPVRLDERVVITMPYIRAENPVTKTNWEGTGVSPDVEVSADRALDRAVDLARERVKR